MAMEYTPQDLALCDEVILELRSRRIEFQFPPHILTDNRRGNWVEGKLGGPEPIASFTTSEPREMALSWTYIIDGGLWRLGRVVTNIRAIRGYFQQFRDAGNNREGLVVKFKMFAHGGETSMSARILNVNVKHGETKVIQDAFGRSNEVFPLRSDISVDLRLWTQAPLTCDEPAAANQVIDPNTRLQPCLPADWY